MFEIITYGFLLILVVVGLCDILHSLWMLLLKPAKKVEQTLVCFLDGTTDSLILTGLYEKYRWHGRDLADRIVVIHNADIDENVVSEFSKKGFIFIEKDKFPDDFFASRSF